MPSYRERVGRHSGQSPGRVRIAEDDDLEQIAEIETRADEVFSVDVVAQLPASKNNPESLRAAAVVLVAGRPAVGFARVDVVDGLAHLEQLERPARGRPDGDWRRARRGRLPVGGRSRASGP